MAWTYTNVPAPGGVVDDNFEQLDNNASGLGGKTIIATIEKGTGSATEAEIVAVLKALGSAGGSGNGTDTNGPDAFTVAGFQAATLGTDPAYVALQGTGTLDQTSGAYGTDITVTAVVTFAPAK